MKFLIIGYGKMGKEIEKFLLEQHHEIVHIIDHENDWDLFKENADVAIEFSTPDTVVDNLITCFKKNIPVVTGTTAWHQHLDLVTEKCQIHNGTLLWGSNFSIGMNVFFELNRQLASMMNAFADYHPHLTEAHHIHKLDKPSGTAVHLANDILKLHNSYSKWTIEPSNCPEHTLPIEVIRQGEIKGTHTVSYESNNDIISIHHEALSRQGFALGAVLSALWIIDKKGVFSFAEFFQELTNKYTPR